MPKFTKKLIRKFKAKREAKIEEAIRIKELGLTNLINELAEFVESQDYQTNIDAYVCLRFIMEDIEKQIKQNPVTAQQAEEMYKSIVGTPIKEN